LATDVMYIRYRDIQDEHTQVAFMANCAVFFYASRADSLLLPQTTFMNADIVETASIQFRQYNLRTIMDEVHRRITANMYYADFETDPAFKDKVVRLKKNIDSCSEGYCFAQLKDLLNNGLVEVSW